MLSVTNKPFILSVIILNVVMLSVVAPFFSKCFPNIFISGSVFDYNFVSRESVNASECTSTVKTET